MERELKEPPLRPLVWVGTTLKDLKAFPDEVKRVMGYAIHVAQADEKHPDAKPMKASAALGSLKSSMTSTAMPTARSTP